MITAPLVEVTAVTPRSSLLTLDLTGTGFSFLPGQAVIIGARDASERRPYSIACSPEAALETSRLELLIAPEPDGGLGPHLAAAGRGTLIDIDGPLGSFVLPEPPEEDRLLFVAGGTGIAPLRSMIDHALRAHPHLRLSLLYSARRGDEFAFVDEMRAHADAGRLELHLTVTRDDGSVWEGRRGRIDRGHYESVLHDPARTLCFVCGPARMVADAVETLNALGVPGALIRTERWGQ